MTYHKDKLRLKYYTSVTLKPLTQCKTDPQKVLETGVDLLKEMGYIPLLASGTLLGAYRDKDFIKHDTDLDVNIVINHKSKVLTSAGLLDFVAQFQAKGFDILRVMLYDGILMQVVFNMGDVIFDIEFIHTDMDKDWNITVHEHGWYQYDRKFFEITGKMDFKGKEYDTPHPVREFLRHRYGNDFRKPAKSKGAWQDDASNFTKWTS